MSDPIDTLMSEHRLIEQVLDALDGYAARVIAGDGGDGADLSHFVTFIREFADRKHHGKEEQILFSVMVENGFPQQVGPIAVMLEEHTVGRDYVSQLAEVAEDVVGAGQWSDEHKEVLRRAANGFSGLLRTHIAKEDQILYPMASSQLPQAAMDEVGTRCAEFEREHAAQGDTARLEALAQELVSKYAR